jgi:hypothetical protein
MSQVAHLRRLLLTAKNGKSALHGRAQGERGKRMDVGKFVNDYSVAVAGGLTVSIIIALWVLSRKKFSQKREAIINWPKERPWAALSTTIILTVVVGIALQAELAALKQNLGTWRAKPKDEDSPRFFISSAIADQNGSFNCTQGYYMIGVTFKNGNLSQILCRPLAELALH